VPESHLLPKHEKKTAHHLPPIPEEELFQQGKDQEADTPAFTQTLNAPSKPMSSQQVAQLQRMIGNRAVNTMISRRATTNVAQRKTPPPQANLEEEQLDLRGDAEMESVFSTPISAAPVDNVQRGFFDKGKGKNASQGELSEIKEATKAGITGMGVYRTVKRGLEILNGAKEAAGEMFKGALTEFANLLNGLAIPGFVGLITRIYDAIRGYLEMRGLKDAHDKLAEKQKTAALSPTEENLKEATAHGFGKVKRRFYKAVYLVVSSVVKVVSHLITLLSGGTAAMVSELVAIGATVLEGIKVLYEKGKGFIKWLLNKRGVHRQQSATRILESAYGRDPVALQLLIDLDPMGFIGREKRALKYGYGDPPETKTTDDMYKLLMTFRDTPKKWGSEAEYQADLEVKLKSG